MVLTSVAAFQGLFLDAKIADIQEGARHLGQMVEKNMENRNLFDTVAFLRDYLGEENDICITDEK